jgi:hypothetical protein
MIEAELPDGTILEFPAGTPDNVVQRAVRQQLGIQPPAPRYMGRAERNAPLIRDLATGFVRGAGSIGATLIRPFETAEENAMRRRQITEGLTSLGVDPNSFLFGAGKLGGEVAGTLGTGGLLARGLLAAAPAAAVPAVTPFATALSTGGFRAGAATLPGNIAARTAGGATVGGASSFATGDDVGTGAGVGAVLGATLGPVLGGGTKALTAFSSLFSGLTPAGRQRVLREQLDTLAGPDRTRVIEELRNAKELVSGSRPTAAEAISDIPSAVELAAAQRKLASSSGTAGIFATRTAENQAARVRAINEIAGTEAEQAALAVERGAVTGPMRETALDLSEVAGTRLGNIDRQVNQSFNALAQQIRESMSPGMADFAIKDLRATSREAAVALKRAQVDSLERSGIFPLLASDITDQLDTAIKGTVSDQSRAVLQAVREKILSKADRNGIISSRDLYENVRKISNQEIAKLLGLGEQYASGGIPQQAASALSNVKKLIDASLDKSSEGLWSKYIGSYKDYSERLNRMEIGDYLSKRLQTPLDNERAGMFATAVENAASTIKSSTGIPRYDKLSQVLTPKEVGTVNSILADLRRSSKANELARQMRAVDTSLPDASNAVPPLLDRTLTFVRSALEFMQRGNQEAFNRQMAELMANPAAMAQFMSVAIPKGRIGEVTSAMMKLMNDPTRTAFTQVFAIPTVDILQPTPGQ